MASVSHATIDLSAAAIDSCYQETTMAIGPIWRASLRNKTGPVLIAIQIALTLAVLVNSVFIIQQRIEKINRPTGMDIENIFTVFSSGIGEDFDGQANADLDVAAIAAIPGVVAATSTIQMPLSGSGWGTIMKANPGEDEPTVNAAQFFFNENGLETMGLTLESGRDFTKEDVEYPENFNFKPPSVIITRDFADELFPDGGALGSTIYSGGDDPSTVIGIVERMHGSWVSWDKLGNVMLLIRTEPGECDRVMPVVEETLRQINDRRIIRDMETLSDIKADSYEGDKGMAILLSVIVMLMVAVTGVGIVGLASFAVKQRIKQIGTRRAVGARRKDILRYFMLENWLITTVGVVIGTVLAFVVNYWLVSSFELERLNALYVPVGIFALWGLGLLAVAGPAHRASGISPAIATRTV
jgi:putative ABC transport system permease protein